MNGLKRWFALPFFLAHGLLLGLALLRLNAGISAWAGVAVCATGPLLTLLWFYRRGSTSARLPWLIGSGMFGVLLTMALPGITGQATDVRAIAAAVISVDLVLLYVFWYSKLDTAGVKLAVGQGLPEFSLQEQSGAAVSSRSLAGRPALLMFYRGNWCPLCMVQVREIAAEYRRISEAGVQVVLISSQPHAQTQALAARFDVPFRFLVDADNTAARQLGLLHKGAVPAGIPGYGRDAALPTVLITDATGKIVFLETTDNYRVRPEPESFLSVIEAL